MAEIDSTTTHPVHDAATIRAHIGALRTLVRFTQDYADRRDDREKLMIAVEAVIDDLAVKSEELEDRLRGDWFAEGKGAQE